MSQENPNIAQAKSLFEAGNPARAKRVVERTLRSFPDLIEAHDLLGSIEMQRGNFTSARTHFEKALSLKPDQGEILFKLGVSLKALKQQEDSRQSFEKVLEIDPENFNAQFALAGIEVNDGNLEKAQALLENCTKTIPPLLEPYRLLATITPRKNDPDFLKHLLDVRKKVSGYSNEDMAHLEFAIAGAALSQGQREIFNEHVNAANQCLSTQPEAWYPANNFVLDQSKEIFTKDVFRKNSTLKAKQFTPIFIVGLPRSGSTLLEQILASHSKVFGADELPFVRGLFVEDMTRHYEMPYPKFFPGMPQEDKVSLAGAYQEKVLAHAPRTPFIVDKMVGNSFFIGPIKTILPWAKVIHIKRHPADTALSMYSSYFDASIPYANNLEELARYFRMHKEYMDLWNEVCPGFVHEIKYENLVKDLEKESKSILKFCGLEWEPACLDFHKTQRTVATLSAGQVRNKIYSSSIGRWKEHKELLAPFTNSIEDLLKDYGY